MNSKKCNNSYQMSSYCYWDRRECYLNQGKAVEPLHCLGRQQQPCCCCCCCCSSLFLSQIVSWFHHTSTVIQWQQLPNALYSIATEWNSKKRLQYGLLFTSTKATSIQLIVHQPISKIPILPRLTFAACVQKAPRHLKGRHLPLHPP